MYSEQDIYSADLSIYLSTYSNLKQIRKSWSSISKIKSRYGELNDDQLKEVIGCIAIGIECTEVNPQARPSAASINSMVLKASPLKDGLVI